MHKTIMHTITRNFLILFILGSGLTCSTNPPEIDVADINITIKEKSSTEIFLRISSSAWYDNSQIQLKRNDQIIFTLNQSIVDTIILDDSLSPNREYTYQAYKFSQSNLLGTSDKLKLSTLDTTNHDFTWLQDTLGDGASSALFDVAILDDSTFLAVGEIYVRDSLGTYESPYGVAKWENGRWNLKRLYVRNLNGRLVNIQPVGIKVFSSSDIWMARGGVFHWDGSSDTMTPYYINSFPGNPDAILEPGQIAMKVWGQSSRNLYAVGSTGALAKFDGTVWQRLTSGTTSDVNNIFGMAKTNGDGSDILCAASNRFTSGESKLLKIEGINVSSLAWPVQNDAYAIWFRSMQKIYVGGGDGVYVGTPDNWKRNTDVTNSFPTGICGNSLNDIFVVGAFGLCSHYNGISWKNYLEVSLPDGSYEELDVSTNRIVAVGYTGNRAIALRGHRNR